MTARRRFTADFKARVALAALRGDKTIQEIATKHKVHPNQVSSWKRQALDGLGAVFSNGSDHARRDHDCEVRHPAWQFHPLQMLAEARRKIAEVFRRHILASFHGAASVVRSAQTRQSIN